MDMGCHVDVGLCVRVCISVYSRCFGVCLSVAAHLSTLRCAFYLVCRFCHSLSPFRIEFASTILTGSSSAEADSVSVLSLRNPLRTVFASARSVLWLGFFGGIFPVKDIWFLVSVWENSFIFLSFRFCSWIRPSEAIISLCVSQFQPVEGKIHFLLVKVF